jgi:hypothetical protein
MMSAHLHVLLGVFSLALIATMARQSFADDAVSAGDASAIRYKTLTIDGVDTSLLNTGHFALEDSVDEIAALMLTFLDKHNTK